MHHTWPAPKTLLKEQPSEQLIASESVVHDNILGSRGVLYVQYMNEIVVLLSFHIGFLNNISELCPATASIVFYMLISRFMNEKVIQYT